MLLLYVIIRIRNRIVHRIHELENLPPGIPDQLYKSAMIEVKALRLLDFQRKVGVVMCMWAWLLYTIMYLFLAPC